jgi:hypothetical protein
MAVLARYKIILMMTSVTPLNIRFGKGGNGCGRWRKRVNYMTIIAAGNCLGVFRIMRHESMRSDLLPTRRNIFGVRRCEFIERSVTIETGLLGRHRRGGGLWSGDWGCRSRPSRTRKSFKDNHRSQEEQKQTFEQGFKVFFHHSFTPG